MIIEWNHHMFSSDTAKYPFHPNAAYVPGPERRSGNPLSDYLLRMKDEGIDRAVIVHPEPYGDDHSLALDCVKAKPDLFKTTALFYPKDSEAPSKLEKLLADNPDILVAHRFHAHEGKRTYLDSFADETVQELWEVAGSAGIINELHIDSSYAAQVEVLIKDNPSYPVLIDHLAEAKYGSGPDFGAVIELAKYPNVYMKLSGLNHFAVDEPHYESARPFTRWVADAFGPERVVWGSGTPKIVDAHLSNWSESDRDLVKGGNLQNLLGF